MADTKCKIFLALSKLKKISSLLRIRLRPKKREKQLKLQPLGLTWREFLLY